MTGGDYLIDGRAWLLGPAAIDYIAAVRGIGAEAAALELKTAMQDGLVKSRGPQTGAHAELFSPEFWRFAMPDHDGSAFELTGIKRLPWFEVFASDILGHWLCVDQAAVPPHSPGTARRKPGPAPATGARVEAEMRQLALDELRRLKQVEMRVHFKASESLCREVRKKILAELGGDPNSA